MAANISFIKDLPFDMLDNIFKFLPLSDRKSASLACSQWSDLAFNRRSLRNVTFQLSPRLKQQQIALLQNSTRCYRNLIIFFEPKTFCQDDFRFVIAILDMFGSDLESFHCLARFSEEQLWYMIARAPNLRRLVIGLNGSTLQQFTFPKLKYLKELGSLYNVLQIRSLDTPNLSQLTATFANSSDVEASISVLRRLAPQLKEVELHSTKCLIPIEDLKFPQVKTLALREGFPISNNEALRSFFSGFEFLTDVILGIFVDGPVLDVMTQACPRIERLVFSFKTVIPNMFSLLGRLKHLKTLWPQGICDAKNVKNCAPLVSVKQLVINVSNLTEKPSVMKRLRKLLPNVVDMNVTLTVWGRDEMRCLQVLRQVCAHFSHLKRLTIMYFDNSMMRFRLSDALSRLEQLEELTISLVAANKPIEFMVPRRSLKRLKLLNNPYLTDNDLLVLTKLYPNLKYLELLSCTQVTTSGIAAFQANLPECVVHYVNQFGIENDIIFIHSESVARQVVFLLGRDMDSDC